MSKTTEAPISVKKAFTLQEAADSTGLGISTISAALRAGELTASYGGPKKSKPVIRSAELDRWLESLPTEKPDVA